MFVNMSWTTFVTTSHVISLLCLFTNVTIDISIIVFLFDS